MSNDINIERIPLGNVLSQLSELTSENLESEELQEEKRPIRNMVET